MVIGIASGLMALGLALPTGLAFGYGYGYGVRQGYSAFKPPGKTAMGLKQSPNPVDGSLGMGLQVAEERTNTLNLGRPSLQSQEGPLMSQTNEETRRLQEKDRLRMYRAPKYKPSTYRRKR